MLKSQNQPLHWLLACVQPECPGEVGKALVLGFWESASSPSGIISSPTYSLVPQRRRLSAAI